MEPDLLFPDNIAQARDPEYIARVASRLGLLEQGEIEFVRMNREFDNRLLEYAFKRPITLEGPEYGLAEGVTIDEPARIELRFDAAGHLASLATRLTDEHHWESVKNHIKSLAAGNLIGPNKTAHSVGAGTESKPWFVEVDSLGRKRLKRAFIS